MFKKSISTIFSSLFIISTIFIGMFSISDQQKINQEKVIENNTVTRSVKSSYLKDDVESLSFSADLTNETISYDITFASNKYNGEQTKSYIFRQADSEWHSADLWKKYYFEDSLDTVSKREASGSASISEVIFLGNTYQPIIFSNYGLESSFGVSYLKDGEWVAATTQPIRIQIFYLDWLYTIGETTMTMNEAKTVAQVNFSFTTDEKLAIDKVNLKSHIDSDLNQSLYDANKDEYSLVQGSNQIKFNLLSEYHYQSLYLEYSFATVQDASYKLESNIEIAEFTSGIVNTRRSFETGDLILLIIILFIILIFIIFIALIAMQMQKRKKLEKQQQQEYYDNHYEDGIK